MEFLLYLAKSAGILTLFYLIYLLVLRKDTFFTANRTYLLTGIIAAIALPFVTFTTITLVEAPIVSTTPAFTELVSLNTTSVPISEQPINLWDLLFWCYITGVSIMLLHFFIQLSSLLRLLRKYPSTKKHGFRFVEIEENVAPFSFFSYIVFNPETHHSEELEMILRHEKVHASQWHSIDLLLANMVRACQWANPVSWFYKASVEANLEFLADNETAQHLPSKTAYQLALLKASSSLPVPALTNNFYHSFIKKRIIMLNKSNSNKYNQLKLTLVLPALAFFLWSFNTEEVITYTTASADKAATVEETDENPALTLRFSANSTNEELDGIEDYFRTNHPESLVKIDNRKRDEQGTLTNFSFKTKFKGNDRFYTRFDRGSGTPFTAIYELQPEDSGVLLVTEIGKDGITLKISKDNMELLYDEGQITSADKLALKPEVNTEAKQPIFGDDPLYIINGKEYRAADLPKDKTIELNGKVEAFNKKEGEKKYGTKGKDGVLYFNGVATFVSNKEEAVSTPVSEEKTHNISEKQSAFGQNATKEIHIKITKKTTRDDLEAIKIDLKETHDIDFNYSNVSYNRNGEITAISINYSGHGNSGNYQVTSDDGEAIDDFFFYMDTEKQTSGFGSGEYEARAKKRSKMMEKRAAVRVEGEARRQEMIKERKEKMAAIRNEIQEESNEIREESNEIREKVAEIREETKELREAERNLARNYARSNQNTWVSGGDKTVITKNTTDSELAAIKKEMEAKGIRFNFSRVKRNTNGEITRIKIESDNGNGSTQTITTNTRGDDAIENIVLEY